MVSSAGILPKNEANSKDQNKSSPMSSQLPIFNVLKMNFKSFSDGREKARPNNSTYPIKIIFLVISHKRKRPPIYFYRRTVVIVS